MRLSGRGTASAAGILLILGSVASAVSKWYLVWLAQRLGGAEAVGMYGLLFAFATPLFVVAQLGLRTIFVSMETAWPWRAYVRVRVVGLGAASVVWVVFSLLHPGVPLALSSAVLLMKVTDSVVDLDLARIQYGGELVKLGFLVLLSGPLSMVLSTLAGRFTGDLSAAVAGSAIGSLAVAALARRESHKIPYYATDVSSGLRDILRASVPVTGAQLLASLLTYLPVFVVGATAELRVVGVFTGTAYILTLANLVGASLANVMITRLRHVRESDGSAAVILLTRRLTLVVTLGSSLLGGVFVVIGSPLLVFIYGPEFRQSPLSLCFFALASVCMIASYMQSLALNVLNRYYRVAACFAVACGAAMLTGLVLTAWAVDGLVVGSAMAAAGAVARVGMMALSNTKYS